jgi:hypothetical protein
MLANAVQRTVDSVSTVRIQRVSDRKLEFGVPGVWRRSEYG